MSPSGASSPRETGWFRLALLTLVLALLPSPPGPRAGESAASRWVKGILETRLSAALSGQVRIGSLDLDALGLEARFADVTITIPARGAKPLEIRVASGRASLDWRSLVALPAGRIQLGEVLLEDPFLAFEQAFLDAWLEERRSRPEKPPVEIRIARLLVRGGRFSYRDARTPLEFEARSVALDASWSDYRRMLVGAATAETTVSQPPFARPFPLRVRSAVRIGASAVEFADLVAAGPGLELDLAGRAMWGGVTAFSAAGRAASDLGALHGWLDPGFPEMEGALNGPLTIDRSAGGLHITGRFAASNARFGPLEALRAEAQADYRPGTLRLDRLAATAYGGRIGGIVEVSLRDPVSFRAAVSGESLDSLALFRLAGIGLPFTASTRLEMELHGQAADRSTWSGSGRVTCEPSAGDLPAAGSGTFALEEGRLAVRGARVQSGAAAVSVDIEADVAHEGGGGKVAVAGNSSSAAETQRGVLRILGSLGIDAPEILLEPLSGSGSLETRVVFGSRTSVDVRLGLSGGSWLGHPFDAASLDLGLRGGVLTVRDLDARRGSEALWASAELSVDPLAVNALDARASDLDVAPFLARLESVPRMEGRLTGEVRLLREAGGLAGEGSLALRDGCAFGETIEEARASLGMVGGILGLEGLTLRGPALDARGSVRFDPSAGFADVQVEEGALQLGRLDLTRDLPVAVLGTARVAEGTLRVTGEGPFGDLVLRSDDWTVDAGRFRLGSATLGEARAVLRFSGGGLSADVRQESGETCRLGARLGFSGDLPLEARLDAEALPVEIAVAGLPAGSMELSGSVDAVGPALEPSRIRIGGALRHARLELGASVLTTDMPVPFRLDGESFVLDGLHLTGQDSEIDGGVRARLSDGALDARLRGRVDLGLLTAQWPDLRALGPVRLDVAVGGTLDAPDLRGEMALEGGSLRVPGIPQSFDGVDVAVRLEGQDLRVERLTGYLGGGEVTGSGWARLDGLGLGEFHAEVEGTNLRFEYPEGFRGVYEGRLALDGTPAQSRLAGRVDLLSGLYRQEFPTGIGDLLLRKSREYVAETARALPRNVFLDVDVVADGNVWVRNELVRLESGVRLHFGGELARPKVVGRVTVLEGGTIEFRDVEYRVVAGTLDFVGREQELPYLDLRAQTKVRDYEVYLRVEGTLDRFEYELTSNPALPTQDIIVLLLTGDTLQSLQKTASGTTGFGQDMAASYFAGALTGAFGRQIGNLLGLEKVQINPMLVQGESDPTTRITLGKRVAKRLTLVYSTDIGTNERQLYQAEFEANRRLRVLAKQDTVSGLGSEVTYSDRFWMGRKGRPDGAEPSTAVEPGEAEGALVTAVELTGADPAILPRLPEKFPVATGQPLSRASVLLGAERIRRLHVGAGRLEAKVRPEIVEEETGARVVYRVASGPPVRVTIDGVAGRDRRRLRKELERFWGETEHNRYTYLDAEDLLRQALRARGYANAEVRSETSEEGGVRLVRFLADTGLRVKVVGVAIEGAREVPEERVRQQILTAAGTVRARRFDARVLDADVAAVRSLYADQGFLQAQVRSRIEFSARGDTARIVFGIEEGPRFRVSAVRATGGLAVPPETLVLWSGLAPGDVFSPAHLGNAEASIRKQLDLAGYPEARVESSFEPAGSGVNVSLEVDTGPRLSVGAVEIEGQDRTKPRVIRRELGLAQGDLLSGEKILDSQRDLYRLNIFRDVRIDYRSVPGEGEDRRTLRVRVEESPPYSATVGAGYDTEGGPRGFFSVTNENLGGLDRTLSLQVRASDLEKRVQLVGTAPRLFGKKVPTLFSVYHELVDRPSFTEERQATAVRVEKAQPGGWTHYLRYNYQRVDITDVADPDEVTRQKLSNLQLGDIGYSVVWDARDDPFNASRGGYASMELRLFHPALLSEETFFKIFLRSSGIWTTRAGTSFATSVRLGVAEPMGDTLEVPISERYFAGGDSTLRGFPRDEVGPKTDDGIPLGGEASLVLNQEFRFPVWKRLQGVLFYDVGNVYRTLDDAKGLDLRHTLGAGLRMLTPIGPLRLEYGRKLDPEPGESDGELFFAIGAAF